MVFQLSHSDFCFFKQKTAYEMRISDWSSDVCSSDLGVGEPRVALVGAAQAGSELGLHGQQASPRCLLPIVEPAGLVHARQPTEIGRASCRERVCQYV